VSWLGVSIGALVGGAGAFVASKALRQKADPAIITIGVVGGGLIGGAFTAVPAAAATGPTLHTIDLAAGDQSISARVGDVIDLTIATSTITAIDAHGSDVVSVASTSPATVNVVKAGGALLTVTTANGETTNVKITAVT